MSIHARKLQIRDFLPGWSHLDGGYIDRDVHTFSPKEADCVDFRLELAIAERPDAATSRFTVRIVTPKALGRATPPENGVLTSRATLVVSEFDWDAIQRHLDDIVGGMNHLELAHATDLLQEHFRWEYDDFNASSSQAPVDGALELELRNIVGPEGTPFRSLHQVDSADVDYRLKLTVGAVGSSEAAVVTTRVVTPAALLELPIPSSKVHAGHPILVLSYFDWRDALVALGNIVERCRARSFDQVVWRLRRFFALEVRTAER